MARRAWSKGLWSVILAGGEGQRLSPFVQRWLGRHKPKQYCTFIGTRSMFQHTLDRADRLSIPERRVTVIAESHRGEVISQLADRAPGTVIAQPANRDTAAGIFLAASYIRARDPKATLVVYPSDHFVYPEAKFVGLVANAIRVSDLLPEFLVLLAVAPTTAEMEYGWIRLGSSFGCRVEGRDVRVVEEFVEKPNLQAARELMLRGSLWNTLVLVAKVETIWTLGWLHFPEMMAVIEECGPSLGTAREKEALETAYQIIPSRNISSHFLQHIPSKIAAITMNEVLWSDWGKPQRIVDALQRIGKESTFPFYRAEESFNPPSDMRHTTDSVG